MGPHLEKRSLSLAGHRTSVALEPAFWAALERLAAARGLSLVALVAEVDAARAEAGAAEAAPTSAVKVAAGGVPLASALRVAALRGAPPPPGPAGPAPQAS